MRSGRISEKAVRWGYNATATMVGAFGLKEIVRQHLLPRLLGVLHSTESRAAFEGVERHVESEIKRIVEKPGPVVVGPWLSEIGFELLYWIPLLHWARERFGLDPDRLVIISRGGARNWYEGLLGRYLDIFDFVNPQLYATLNRERWASQGRQKQLARDTLDDKIIAWASEVEQLHDFEVLHPSLMYQLLWPIFQSRRPVEDLFGHACLRALSKPALPNELANLVPGDYVAVRFYFRPSFPDTDANRDFVRQLTTRLSGKNQIVLLNTGLEFDDHADCPAAGLIDLSRFATPPTNLEIQSAVIANSRAFVGTYGGLSYLAAFYGVPSVGFFSNESELKPSHRSAARAVCNALGSQLIELDAHNLKLLEMII
jgi:hypothetical protein